jgi:hypothetical protein
MVQMNRQHVLKQVVIMDILDVITRVVSLKVGFVVSFTENYNGKKSAAY